MAVNQTIHYELATAADLGRLAADLFTVDASTIVVGFYPSDDWDPTELEIARLVASARSNGKKLIAERGRGQVAERAVMLGFQDMAMVSDLPSVPQQTTSSLKAVSELATTVIYVSPREDQSEQPTTVVRQPDLFQDTDNIATYRPSPDSIPTGGAADDASPDSSPEVDNEPEPETSDDLVLLGPPIPDSIQAHQTVVMRQPAKPRKTRKPVPKLRVSEKPVPEPVPIGRLPLGDETASAASAPPTAPEPDAQESRYPRLGILKISAAILAPIIVLGVVAGLAVYMLPTATVTLVPREEPISSTLTYGVASTTAEFDISIDPELITSSFTTEAAREATGERFEPVGTAAGTIQITNPLPHEVTVPAGTELPGPQGVMYYTAEDVRLTPADPYGAMSFGSGVVGVYAGVIGPDGNVDAGLLTGQLGNEIFYTNPEGIWGGRMERYSVLTDEDIQAVYDSVASELTETAPDEFAYQVPDGFEIVPGTVSIGDPDIEVTGSAGSDAQTVSASGSISIEAYIYDPAELHRLAGDEADRQLARQGGSERILLAETVTFKEPTDLDSDDPGFQINVEAIARTVITEAEKDQLVKEITGLTREEAEALLRTNPKVDRYEISIEPQWLFDRMPEITSRISVHVSSGEQTASR